MLYLLLLLTTRIFLTAALIPTDYVLHEQRRLDGAKRWLKIARVPGNAVLPVRIGLRQNAIALEKAHNWLMEVSHPASNQYGQHWTQDQVIDAFQPTEATVNAVRHWLTTEGSIPNRHIVHTDNKAWLAFYASAHDMEKLLKSEFYEYRNQRTGSRMVSCDRYYIPNNLSQHIDYITPGVKGTVIRGPQREIMRSSARLQEREASDSENVDTKSHNRTSLANCDTQITPACIRALYHIPPLNASAKVSRNNSLGIFEVSSSYLQKNLNRFYAAYMPEIPKGWGPVFHGIDGGLTPAETKSYKLDNDNPEADLDFQCAIPIVYPQKVVDFQTDDSNGGYYEGLMNTFFDAIDGSYCNYTAYGETGDAPEIDPTYPDHRKGQFTYKGALQCGVWKPTNVVTTSYAVYEQDLPYYYQKRQCNELLKLGLQGVSVFGSAGDTGVNGDNLDTKRGCLGKNGNVFDISNLRGCPYMTAVGATKMQPNSTVHDPEIAAFNHSSRFYSGGGFSNVFEAPDYQNGALKKYFNDHSPQYPYYHNGNYNGSTNGVYNRNGRGIPDVSANGQHIAMFWKGHPWTLEGTSASSPFFAAIITRINEDRIAKGKSPVGFINPVLYEHPEILNDITEGHNPGCGTRGFKAVKGWDPVTGLGTPNYPKMLKLFLSLP